MELTTQIVEKLFPYDPQEYAAWSRGEAIVNQLVERCGPLTRSVDSYMNQALLAQNYPEVRYAVELVERLGFPRAGLFYENFTLSLDRLEELKHKTGHRAAGAEKISAALSPEFFRAFDRLREKNADRLADKTSGNPVPDLCAIDTKGGRILFLEVKKYNVGKKTTETFSLHQQLAMAFISHIHGRLGNASFCSGAGTLGVELISFVPEADFTTGHIAPRRYEVVFNS